MRASAEIQEVAGVSQAFAFMATEINKKTRIRAHLISAEVREAQADDLILIVESNDELMAQKALDEFEMIVTASGRTERAGDQEETAPATFEQGIAKLAANLAIISVPGPYAALQTLEALNHGMHVQLFSDNVSLEEEIALKEFAIKRGLLVMGPDCGTSIISGIPICFANVVKPGTVGVIGASGTGLQEFTVLLDAADCGITHAIGVGGRDLTEEVGGRSALFALEMLLSDVQTKVLAVVSKPPSESAGKRIIEAIKQAKKPAVLCFLGAKAQKLSDEIYIAGTIEEAAAKTAALVKSQKPDGLTVLFPRQPFPAELEAAIKKLSSGQTRIQGLYTGGTLASEAKYVIAGTDHSVIDLGDDEYTQGSLHPMIDPSNRKAHIMAAFSDPGVAVLLCDVVLGYGSHIDPAAVLAENVKEARKQTGANIIVIASVTGTDQDPQNRTLQETRLIQTGIFVYPSNQYAAETAANVVNTVLSGGGS